MSAHEIIAELPRLNRVELEAVDAKLDQLPGRSPARHWGEAMGGCARRLAEAEFNRSILAERFVAVLEQINATLVSH